MEQNIAEFEYLALVINYNEFLGRTILKKEYFEKKNSVMFNIIKTEYDKNNALTVSKLANYKNFDLNYFMELLESNMYNSSREMQFKILENKIIEQFKERTLKKIISSFNGNVDNFYKLTDKLRELKIEENEYITCEDVINTLEEEHSQVKLGFNDLDNALYISQNDFVILAGGTGTGKTTFALNLLSNLSKEYQCVYFNMEMSKKLCIKDYRLLKLELILTNLTMLKVLMKKKIKYCYTNYRK